MPIYRGPDGKIIEERTKKVPGDAMTRHTPQQHPVKDSTDMDRTRKVGDAAQSAAPHPAATVADSARTRYAPAGTTTTGTTANPVSDPVVGWLAVVAGPGKGQTLALGYGANSIGRGSANRVNLDFGDEQVSRAQHTIITYDPRGRKFYLQPGGNAALTYCNDQPLLTPQEISRGARVALGNTTLHFQPLCGPDFDWQDLSGT